MCSLYVCVILGNQRFFPLCWHNQRLGQTLGSLERGLWAPYSFLCKTYHSEDQLSPKGT